MNSENERFWNALSQIEEMDLDDEKINRLLRLKAMKPYPEDVNTILDIGARTGAFSIPLAEKGFKVTHLDISEEMSKSAQNKARGLSTIQFVKRNASDLSCFADNAFDLVISFDARSLFPAEKPIRSSPKLAAWGKNGSFRFPTKAA